MFSFTVHPLIWGQILYESPINFHLFFQSQSHIQKCTWKYVGCSESKERLRLESKEHLHLESKERLCIQPAQVFHCTRSVIWCVQLSVDSYLVVNDLQMMRIYSMLSWTG
jgi:hypothetical protein